MKKYEILIVEDDKAITRLLELEFNYEGYSFDVAYDGRSGFNKFLENEYQLIILDLMLPELSGLDVCRKIRKTSSVPVIMLTARRDLTDKIMGLDIGADDYVTKPFEMEELLARIRAALRRSNLQSTQEHRLVVDQLSLDTLTREVFVNDVAIELTKTEYNLLEYLLLNKGLVLTREQILEHVWAYDFEGDSNVLDVYIRYLRNKIDYPFKLDLIHTVRGVGYSIKEPK